MKKGEAKPGQDAEWERKRVQAWLRIVGPSEMTSNKSTQLRAKQFKERYDQLEAEVPTP